MDVKEFSDKFDTLLNSYKTSVPYGYEQGNFDFTLNEYEKSVYLTQALRQKIQSYFSSTTDVNYTFEGSENARKSMEALVYDAVLETSDALNLRLHIVNGSKFFSLEEDSEGHPLDVWFVVYESLVYTTSNEDGEKKPTECIYDSVDSKGWGYTIVVPITHDDFYRTYSNPFRGATNRRALRLTAGDKLYEVVSKYPIDKYFIRYVRKPEPIILEDLPDNLTIDGKSEAQTCLLDDSLHEEILSMAVLLALQYHSLTTGKVPVPQLTSSKKDDND